MVITLSFKSISTSVVVCSKIIYSGSLLYYYVDPEQLTTSTTSRLVILVSFDYILGILLAALNQANPVLLAYQQQQQMNAIIQYMMCQQTQQVQGTLQSPQWTQQQTAFMPRNNLTVTSVSPVISIVNLVPSIPNTSIPIIYSFASQPTVQNSVIISHSNLDHQQSNNSMTSSSLSQVIAS